MNSIGSGPVVCRVPAMSYTSFDDRDRLQQLIGSKEQQLLELKTKLAQLQQASETGAREWQKLVDHREELADWLLDQATNEEGLLVRSIVDAALGGELFVPGFMTSWIS